MKNKDIPDRTIEKYNYLKSIKDKEQTILSYYKKISHLNTEKPKPLPKKRTKKNIKKIVTDKANSSENSSEISDEKNIELSNKDKEDKEEKAEKIHKERQEKKTKKIVIMD